MKKKKKRKKEKEEEEKSEVNAGWGIIRKSKKNRAKTRMKKCINMRKIQLFK